MKSSVSVWAAVSVLLILVGGAVGFSFAGSDLQSVLYLYGGLTAILATVLPVLFGVNSLIRKSDEQSEKLDTIAEQTTDSPTSAGVRRAVRDAFAEEQRP